MVRSVKMVGYHWSKLMMLTDFKTPWNGFTETKTLKSSHVVLKLCYIEGGDDYFLRGTRMYYF